MPTITIDGEKRDFALSRFHVEQLADSDLAVALIAQAMLDAPDIKFVNDDSSTSMALA